MGASPDGLRLAWAKSYPFGHPKASYLFSKGTETQWTPCPEDVAGKLLPAKTDAGFNEETSAGELGALVPPKDYAAKATPNQKGALSEDFGLEKPAPADD